MSPALNPEDLITIAEAARLRGTSESAISHLIREGRLRFAVGKLLRRGEVVNFEPHKRGRKPIKPKTIPKKHHGGRNGRRSN